MADCEIVLRYFALEDMKYFKGGMRRSLDDCMKRMKLASKKDCMKKKEKYLYCLSIAKKTFGTALFRLPNKNGELVARHSIPLSDAILLGILSLSKKEANSILSSSAKVVSRMKKLLNSDDTYKILVGRANTKSSIIERIDLVTKMFKSVAKGN
jgi:hypothetical protein